LEYLRIDRPPHAGRAGKGGEDMAVKKPLSPDTDRYDMEERFLVTHKLETLCYLVRSTAHDFNNLLTAIIGNAEMLLGGNEVGGPPTHTVRAIQANAMEAAKLSRRLQTLCRVSAPGRTDV